MFKMQIISLLPQPPCPQNHSGCVYLFQSTIINGSWAPCTDDVLHSHTAAEGDELDLRPVDTRPAGRLGSSWPIAKVSLCCWAI